MNKKAPMSMCLIVKNEPLLEQCILSFRDYVEEIVIVDTGSTDGTTVEIAKKYADIFEIYTDCNDKETGLIDDFSKARQRSFDLATKDWSGWLDADDQLSGGEHLIKIIDSYAEQAKRGESIVCLFPYEYSYNELNQCNCLHYRERLVFNRNKFHWVNPVHEVLIPYDGITPIFFRANEVVFKHRRQYSMKQVEPTRNLRILKKYVEGAGKGDARQLYYYGLELANAGLLDDAIENLTEYIKKSGWDDERVMACLKLVDIYQAKVEYDTALKWAFKAIEIKENWCEGYFALGKMFYFLAQNGGVSERKYWEKCVYFITIGLSLKPTETLLFINPQEREVEIHKFFNLALNKLGNIKGALESTRIGLTKSPNDPLLLSNKKIYEVHLAKDIINQSLNSLMETGYINELSKNNILNILNNLPITNNDIVQKIENNLSTLLNVKNDNPLDIVFFIGDGVEPWTPKTFENTGLGGSETMAIEQAKRLAALGNKVKVYSGCGDFGEGFYDGVEYCQSRKFNNLNCDVLIISRRADMLSDKFNVNAKLKLLWVHDVCALGATDELLLKADRILALSKWHKQNLINAHNLHEDKVIITRNGIDLSRFNKTVKRNKFKCINSSSPDRSWPILLSIWPQIKMQVPEAELHLYYGFKNWKFMAQHDSKQMDLIKFLEHKIKEMEPLGVVYHDRVNQDKLAEEFLSAGLQLYPTWFSESSNIGGMEAQAAGLLTITSSIAALKETIGPRGILLDGEWTSKEYQDKFVNYVVNAMKFFNEEERAKLQNYARENFGLNDLAKEWNNMFHKLLNDLKVNPLTPYNPTTHYKKDGRGYYNGDIRYNK